eukprot:403355932
MFRTSYLDQDSLMDLSIQDKKSSSSLEILSLESGDYTQQVEKLIEETIKRSRTKTEISMLFLALALMCIISASLANFAFENLSKHSRISYTFSIFTFCVGSFLLMKRKPEQYSIMPTLVTVISIIVITERQIFLNPNQYTFAEPVLGLTGVIQYFNTILLTRRQRILCKVIIWTYYTTRNYQHYGYFSIDLTISVILYSFFIIQTFKVYENFQEQLKTLYKQQQSLIKEKWQKTLEMIPQGVVIIDTQSEKITIANKEIQKIFKINQITTNDYLNVKKCLEEFKQKDLQIDTVQENEPHQQDNLLSKENRENQQKTNDQEINQSMPKLIEAQHEIANNQNSQPVIQQCQHNQEKSMWTYIFDKNANKKKIRDSLFKNKKQNLYFQVKASNIAGGTQVIAVLNDISKIKELEKTAKKLRNRFFSQISHELRTPLNSIIPLTQRLKNHPNDPKKDQYISIILNSSLHLENLVEDALDMSRLENNKFVINRDYFDVRLTVQQTIEIMEIQVKQKHLQLILEIDDSVSKKIFSDQKRYKQVLFNLVGNAIKFTFKGFIKLKLEYKDKFLITTIEDTGIGIQESDLSQLFKFFGKLVSASQINKGGMGLGLNISKLIVNQLKGQISVHSNYKKGTTFIFTILDEEEVLSQNESNQNIIGQSLEDSQSGQQVTTNNILYENDTTSHDHLLFNKLQSNDRMNDFSLNKKSIMRQNSQSIQIEESKSSDYSEQSYFVESNNFNEQTLDERMNLYNSTTDHIPKRDRNLKEDLNESKVNRILIVDDQPYNLFVLEELLSSIDNNFIIDKALNGEQAIEQVMLLKIQTSTEYDFIFLDLNMPVMDGQQTMRKLMKMNHDGTIELAKSKVIALSAMNEDNFLKYDKAKLFKFFVEKPVRTEQLKSVIRDKQ